MFARSFLVLTLIFLSTAPAYAHRGSGRAIDKTDTPTLTKGQGAYADVFSCMIWEKQGDRPAQDYAEFIGTDSELSQTLSELRSWHPASIWGCD